jgi:hypothetical protein
VPPDVVAEAQLLDSFSEIASVTRVIARPTIAKDANTDVHLATWLQASINGL